MLPNLVKVQEVEDMIISIMGKEEITEVEVEEISEEKDVAILTKEDTTIFNHSVKE